MPVAAAPALLTTLDKLDPMLASAPLEVALLMTDEADARSEESEPVPTAEEIMLSPAEISDES